MDTNRMEKYRMVFEGAVSTALINMLELFR